MPASAPPDLPPRDRSRGDHYGGAHAARADDIRQRRASALNEAGERERKRALPLRPGEASAVRAQAPTVAARPRQASGARPQRGPQTRTSDSERIVGADARCSSVASAGCLGGWRLFAAVNSPRLRFPVLVSLGGAHLLVGSWFASGVSDPAQALAFELAEPDAVLGVGDVEVEH